MRLRTAMATMAFVLGAASAQGALAGPGKCDLDSIRAITPAPAVIDSVTPISALVPHCQVLGHVITQDPAPNRVEFSVMLPDENFGNRYYFVGEGAAAGFVPTATAGDPMNAGYLNVTLKLLGDGFAVAGTDTGHKGAMWDFGIGNPAARLDHGHRGAHVAAVATQAITKSYYGAAGRLYRYHLGCSGGGRMGAMAVLHHPEDYDGVVVSTGFGGGGSVWFAWILQHLLANPDGWVSPAKLDMLERAVAARCADPDGLVRDPNACGFDPASLQCKAGDSPDCLTAAEVKMVKVITGPYPSGPGETHPGFTLTNPTGWSSFLLGATRPTGSDPKNPWAPAAPPSNFGIMHSIMRGVYFDNASFDFVKDLDFSNPAHLKALQVGAPTWGAVDPDISAYVKRGGKIILWAGLSENAVPPATEIDYYNIQKRRDPNVDDFMRLYLAPGVYHCGGGPGPQDTPERLLDKLIGWVEEGKRPDAIIATAATPRLQMSAAGPVLTPPIRSRTVKLCPYPQRAVFRARKGAFPYDADNWSCEAPAR